MSDNPTDEALMACVREGDQQADAVLVERHLPRAYAIAYRLSGHAAEAEDLAHPGLDTHPRLEAPAWQPPMRHG